MPNKTLTVQEKRISLKGSNVVKNIDLYKCSDEEISRLHIINSNDQNKIPRAANDYTFLNELASKAGNTKAIGKFL
jgi:hypothetical protein